MATKKRPENVRLYTIRDNESYRKLVSYILQNKSELGIISGDLETTSAKDFYSTLVGGTLCFVKDGIRHSYYIPVNHAEISRVEFRLLPTPRNAEEAAKLKDESPFVYHTQLVEGQVDELLFVRGFSAIMNDPDITVAGHNFGGYDMTKILQLQDKHGLREKYQIRCKLRDTMIAAYLLHEKDIGLKSQVKKKLGYIMTELSELNGGDHSKNNLIPIEEMAKYAGDDGWVVHDLLEVYYREFSQKKIHKKKKWVFENIECPASIVLAYMQYEGVKIDVDKLRRLDADFEVQMSELDKELVKTLGVSDDKDFNINSTQQMSELLFDKLGWWSPPPGLERGASGLYPTNKNVIKDLLYEEDTLLTPEGAEVARILQKRSELKQLRDVYTKAIPDKIDRDGRLRCSFNQCVTVTNRLSSSGPNLQNIPARSKNGKKIRECFVVEKDYFWLSLDFSQMEKRIETFLSGDPVLYKIFDKNNPQDIHMITATGAGFVDKYGPEVGRNYGKTFNYQIAYGAGLRALAKALRISESDCRIFYEGFCETYKVSMQYKRNLINKVKRDGFTESLFGNTRSYEEMMSKGEYWNNAAINHPMQATSADFMKLAMVKFFSWCLQKGYLGNKVKLLLTVHDELDIAVHKTVLGEVTRAAKWCMESVNTMDIELPVDATSGSNWAECH